MDALSEDIAKLVNATANRLRLVQIEMAAEVPARREDRLFNELKQQIEQIPVRQQPAFLAELVSRFPTWDQPSDSRPSEQSPPKPPDLPTQLQSLIEAGKAAPESQRRQLLTQLQQAWGVAGKPISAADVAAPLLRNKLGLGSGDPLDVQRALELAGLLVDFVQALDQFVTKTWRAMKPSTPLRPATLQRTMAAFVRGDPQAPMARDLLELRQLAAALTNALSLLGKRFCDQHLARFAPSDIEEAVRVQRGSFLNSLQKRCWRHYCKLANALQESAVEVAINQAVVELVEPFLMAPTGRSAGE